MDFILQLKDIDIIMYILKMTSISILSYYTACKISNRFIDNLWIIFMECIIIAIICGIVKTTCNSLISIFLLIIFLGIIFKQTQESYIGYSLLIVTIATSINYTMFLIATAISFIPVVVFSIYNMYFNFAIILLVYIISLKVFLKIKRLKNGISFLNKSINNEHIDILILNISAIVLMGVIILSDYMRGFTRKFMFVLLGLAIIMFITIQKSIQLYYKQKLLVQELKETKDKLEEKTKEIKELEEENIKISKKSHTLVHKQKSLEHKIEGLIGETEISKEEVGELTNRIKEINKEIYKQKTAIELDKTEIPQIDDMLKYMQSECKKNNIDFELQIKGSIHHMTNNLISKEDLETLLADHIKNAIIAINHGNNINRSILVRIGKIDECYGLYIYDSGIEFEKETLKNLGKKPSTTHANEGGTGMGFMNTFDTLKKCNASLIIEEYNEPSKDNYTKVIKIKFNNKNEFEIKTYREKSTI